MIYSKTLKSELKTWDQRIIHRPTRFRHNGSNHEQNSLIGINLVPNNRLSSSTKANGNRKRWRKFTWLYWKRSFILQRCQEIIPLQTRGASWRSRAILCQSSQNQQECQVWVHWSWRPFDANKCFQGMKGSIRLKILNWSWRSWLFWSSKFIWVRI